jgi:hypothetical protein
LRRLIPLASLLAKDLGQERFSGNLEAVLEVVPFVQVSEDEAQQAE